MPHPLGYDSQPCLLPKHLTMLAGARLLLAVLGGKWSD